MTRVGLVGTESSHVDAFLRLLNADRRHAGWSAVALAGGPTSRNRRLGAEFGLDLVETPAELVPYVDAVIVAGRDGARHRDQAEPLLAAEIPVLVDKPFATTVDDARAIVAAAESSGVVVTSGSALRFVSQLGDLAGRSPHRSPDRSPDRSPHRVDVTGPADPDSPWSGLFFYGIHHVEAALQILGDPVVEPGSVEAALTRGDDRAVAALRIAGADVTLTFVTPRDDAPVPFRAAATGAGGTVERELVLDADYLAPVLARFVGAVTTGRMPVDRDRLVSPVVVMGAIVDALRSTRADPPPAVGGQDGAAGR